ncbi:Hypothetical predicted protein [Octopus vulgaris]|uniref:Uncharacterized protein n=1 Tax=Octopus vulgaris TaxID=6645 RepID=A0AA36B791_OCTVU|nr:Hypothetical predicted protein [Octopus vulgaris]
MAIGLKARIVKFVNRCKRLNLGAFSFLLVFVLYTIMPDLGQRLGEICKSCQRMLRFSMSLTDGVYRQQDNSNRNTDVLQAIDVNRNEL